MSRIEWVSVVVLCTIFGCGITLLLRSMNKDNTQPEELEKVVVRNPVDHTMVLIKHPPSNWKFEHCTPTNKNCGRFE